MKDHRLSPPRIATRLLIWFLKEDLAEEVQGDLGERFYRYATTRSLWIARLDYWRQVLNYFRPFALRRTNSTLSFFMYKHNLLISVRSFKRYKASFFINLIGLSTGLAAAWLIWLWAIDEFNVDKFHKNDSRLYQVMERRVLSDRTVISDESTGILAEALAIEMPEVEYATAMVPSSWFQKFTLSIDDRIVKASGQYVGKDYFNVFSFGLLAGNKDNVLADKNSIVISRDVAVKLFGSVENAIGKTIEYQHERDFNVSGVFENIPANSSEKFEFVLSFEYYKEVQPWVSFWTAHGPHNFVVLREGTDVESFNRKIADIITRNCDEKYRSAFVLPFSDNYLYNTFDHGVRQGGRIVYVRLFLIISFFIVAIACINFMTLATAQASRRLKEIGIKKAIGARKKQLIMQFISESMLVTFLSGTAALLMAGMLLPQFNELTGKQLSLSPDGRVFAMLAIVTIATGIFAGCYPAFYLSSRNPVAIFKGRMSNSFAEVLSRKGLVVFQFVLSIILIVGVVVVYKQVEFIQSKSLGYEKDNILRMDSEGKVLGTQDVFLAEVRKLPGVVNATGTWHNIIGRNYATDQIEWEGKIPTEKIFVEGMGGGYELIPTLGIEMVAGRNFSRDHNNEHEKIILNEAAVRLMNIEDPVGKTIKLYGNQAEIIGVMKDFHYESLHKKVGPMFFTLDTGGNNTWYKLLIKLERGREAEAISHLKELYKAYNPGFTLDYYFLDQAFQKQYVAEQRIATLSRYFAGIAVVISCLGLFGLASFTIERRTKEIGIRKVLGSGSFGIVYLLSAEFTRLVFIAVLIAIPASYVTSTFWLSSFAYKIELRPWIFAGAGFLALVISWLTVSIQTFKAAVVNPVRCLRSE